MYENPNRYLKTGLPYYGPPLFLQNSNDCIRDLHKEHESQTDGVNDTAFP